LRPNVERKKKQFTKKQKRSAKEKSEKKQGSCAITEKRTELAMKKKGARKGKKFKGKQVDEGKENAFQFGGESTVQKRFLIEMNEIRNAEDRALCWLPRGAD